MGVAAGNVGRIRAADGSRGTVRRTGKHGETPVAHGKIEPLTAVLRIYDDHCGPPSPYDWCCTLRWTAPKTVELMGVVKPITHEQLKALRKTLRDYGVLRYIHHRKKDGRDVLVTHEL